MNRVLRDVCLGLLAILGYVLVNSGCVECKNGPELREPGEVIDTCYVPSGHGSDLAVGYNTGNGGGITFTPINITVPERFAVVFKCRHGSFVIDGERGKQLFRKLAKGDHVIIRYCEELEIEGGMTNVVDLHFIGADREISNE